MIAIKTARRLRAFFATLVAFLLLVCAIALIAPSQGRSFMSSYLSWLVGIPAFVGLWFAVEWCGTAVLERPFWNRMPSALRVTLLVAGIALIVLVYLYRVEGIRLA